MSHILTLLVSLTILGPNTLSPTDPLVLEKVEVRRVTNDWGLNSFAHPNTARIAVDDCSLLGAQGIAIVEKTGIVNVVVVDCLNPSHTSLADKGIVADIAPQWGLGHKQAALILRSVK